MPKVETGETRDHYMERCMIYPDLQKHDENQRKAICEHLYDREAQVSEQNVDSGKELVFEQHLLEKPRIDRENGILHHVHILGIHSKRGYDYEQSAHKEAAPYWEGMTVGVDHDYASGPLTLEKTWATVEGPIEVDANGTWGSLRFLKKHLLTEQILEQAESGIGRLGLSPVNTQVIRKGNKVISFRPARLDLVIDPATTKTLWEQNTGDEEDKTLQASVIAVLKDEKLDLAAKESKITEIFEQHMKVDEKTTEQMVVKLVDAKFEQMRNELKEQLVVHEQFVDPATEVKEVIAEVEKAVDLKKFWRD